MGFMCLFVEKNAVAVPQHAAIWGMAGVKWRNCAGVGDDPKEDSPVDKSVVKHMRAAGRAGSVIVMPEGSG